MKIATSDSEVVQPGNVALLKRCLRAMLEMRPGLSLTKISSLPVSAPSARARRSVALAAFDVFARVLATVIRVPTYATSGSPVRKDLYADADLRVAFELVPFALVALSRQDNVVYANQEAGALFSCRPEDMVAAPISRLLPEFRGDNALSLTGTTTSTASTAVERTLQTYIARRHDGGEFLAGVTMRECLLGDKPTLLLGILNLDEKSELHRDHHDFIHLSRVSTLGELAGSIAHELNQPLTAILSNAQAAQRFLDADPVDPANVAEVRDTLQDIVEDDCRAGAIIRNLRALSRNSDIEMQTMDMTSIMRDVIMLVHSEAIRRGMQIRLRVATGPLIVHGDRVQLQQVVLNLLLNSFDAMRDCAPGDRVVSLRISSRPDDTLVIAVSDRGPGLAMDTVDKVFKPFFTSKSQGLGLGLSISRNIVVAHGGRIWAENNPDRGATFSVILPSQPMAK